VKTDKIKAIALLSGGLDSILATRLMLDEGIEVEAVNFVTAFCTCTSKGKTCLASKSAADNLGIKLKVFEVSKEYFEVIKNPRHGYGSNMNPCLDCRIFIFKKAAEYMKSVGASFLFTGEVLGERPMSQRKDAMWVIERDANLVGMIVRPLSAGLMEPSIPEKKGWVNRKKLLSISGRSRKPQIDLAKKFGINDYPCPAGGCLLTDPGFARRMRDLIKDNPDFTTNDILLIKTGRCFRITPEAKLVVGRDKDENERLKKIARDTDTVFYPIGTKGPTGIGRGVFNDKSALMASRIVARYSDAPPDKALKVRHSLKNDRSRKDLEAIPMSEPELARLRV